MSSIGFVGLGNMGLPMALNLIKTGHEVKAFDVNTTAMNAVSAEGGQVVFWTCPYKTGHQLPVKLIQRPSA
ncbi:NAD(P)-binding domain-containing protein [Pseudomonas sp. PD9R]|uniref:NAD(P)-binding domain-containing protein n=1 Tax=Pseudomonas sp. PD9R TaxID=2853534 RepID=UPI001C474200|nr:hypothetical protein [Pseudomonas sp. PD9R]